MKKLSCLLLALTVVINDGCATAAAVNAANHKKDGSELKDGGVPRPGFYLLTPITGAVDIITLPFQGLGWWMLSGIQC